MALRFDFHGWRRSAAFDAVTDATLVDGRLAAGIDLTVTDELNPGDTASHRVDFHLHGPGDIAGPGAGLVHRVTPAPGAPDAEETKCPYVELGADDLPWRYTPQLAAGQVLRPWLVLVVGTPEEVQVNPGGNVTLHASVLAGHDLAHSARWAHTQVDVDGGTRSVARILSARDLAPSTGHVAVLVPAFSPAGQPAWEPGNPSVTLPVFHRWSFTTSEAGDFPTLAGRLKPVVAGPDLGRSPVAYTPVPLAPDVPVRGALAPIGGADAPTPSEVAADLPVLTTPPIDPVRPVVGLPDYGAAWVADSAATIWGAPFRTDLWPRTVGGLGLRAGIDEQQLLADACAAQAGDLAAAAQRLSHLTAGLAAARSLWSRRLPADPLRRLVVLAPALGRMVTDTGTVLERATAGDRPLASALLSSAAARALRTGPARTRHAQPGANDPAAVLTAANRCPDPPERAPAGLPHGDRLEADLELADLGARACAGEADPRGMEDVHVAIRELGLDVQVDIDDLVELGTLVCPPDGKRPCDPIDLDGLATAVAGAVDPTVDRPFMVDRVLWDITGLDDQPLTPPELCPDLDIPAWQFLRDHNPNWLLPGAGTLPEDRVVAVETNPAFVDAFLLGLNTQVATELRFRNIPITSGCTPVRQFWARADVATGTYHDDIVGVHGWPAASGLGTTAHQTPAAASADLVIVFKTPLFRRYPGTVVYLTPAPLDGAGQPDWEADPDHTVRLLPSFQGSITPDLTFFGFDLDPPLGKRHWVVLEEPAHGVQFFNTAPPGMDPAKAAVLARPDDHPDGAAFADAAYADPYRVLLRGSAMIPVGP